MIPDDDYSNLNDAQRAFLEDQGVHPYTIHTDVELGWGSSNGGGSREGARPLSRKKRTGNAQGPSAVPVEQRSGHLTMEDHKGGKHELGVGDTYTAIDGTGRKRTLERRAIVMESEGSDGLDAGGKCDDPDVCRELKQSSSAQRPDKPVARLDVSNWMSKKRLASSPPKNLRIRRSPTPVLARPNLAFSIATKAIRDTRVPRAERSPTPLLERPNVQKAVVVDMNWRGSVFDNEEEKAGVTDDDEANTRDAAALNPQDHFASIDINKVSKNAVKRYMCDYLGGLNDKVCASCGLPTVVIENIQ
ncbi:hypothetical protein HK104_008409 [Borealophlyctis nickersoniae]|nr:hypothetical protein HK104_008409 [Borealophlyctis nickersoniae]